MKEIAEKTTLCPSARPEPGESFVFGIIGGTVAEPRVAYLKQPQPITDGLIAKVSPVTPAEVFRTASTCATNGCQHFDGKNCRLAERVVANISTVAEDLPPCSIRRYCRWWQQEGKAACLRCPQVITDNYITSDLLTQVAGPSY